MKDYVSTHEIIITDEIKQDCVISVVIPIKDEAENVENTLNCFLKQVDSKNQPLDRNSFEIIVLANNCTDESAARVASFIKSHPELRLHLAEASLPPEKANIGYVRRRLMNEAYHRLRQNKHGRGIILTTDGDTCVAPNWIAATLKEIEQGADAVGGRILLKSGDLKQMNEKARRFHLLDTGYRLLAAEIEAHLDYVAHDHLPRHHQHFNGSFAVTTDAYRQAGGIPEVSFLEDVAFFHALMRIDARFRHSPAVRVETSSRPTGRTAMGLSTQINEWTVMGENGDVYSVESAASVINRINLRHLLRKTWSAGDFDSQHIKELAEKLIIPPQFLENELEIEQTFGSLLEKIYHEQNLTGGWKERYPLVCVSRAIEDLRSFLEIVRRARQSPGKFFTQTSNR